MPWEHMPAKAIQAAIENLTIKETLDAFAEFQKAGKRTLQAQLINHLAVLLEKGVLPDEPVEAFRVFACSPKGTELLLQYLDPNTLEHHGYSFLAAHADAVSLPVLKLHVQAGAKVVRYKEQGPLKSQWWYETPVESSPLMDAIRKGQLDQVKIMLASGTVPLQYEEELNLKGTPTKVWIGGPLHLAIEAGHLDIAQYLRRKGARPDAYHERLVLQGQCAYVGADNTLIHDLLPEHKPNNKE